MTDKLTEALEARIVEVAAIDDLVQRGIAAREVREQLAASDHALYAIQQTVVRQLRQGRTWAEVGALFNRTGSWAEALARGRKAKRKSGHAVQRTPNTRATEGHHPDMTAP